MKFMWRKLLIALLVFTVFGLTACTDPTVDDVSIELREGVDTIEIGSKYEDPGAKAKAYGFIITHDVVSNNVNTSIIGVYEIHYSVTYHKITKSIKRIVTVVDTTKPIATLKAGIDTVSLNGTWVDAGITVNDNSGITPRIIISGSVDTAQVGEYVITYTVSDESGNETEINRFVNVVLQTGNMN